MNASAAEKRVSVVVEDLRVSDMVPTASAADSEPPATVAANPRAEKSGDRLLDEPGEQTAEHHNIHAEQTRIFDDHVPTSPVAEPFSMTDATTIDVGALERTRRVGGETALVPPFTGTDTALAAADPAASSPPDSAEITAESKRAIESAPPPDVQPASDPTTTTKLDQGFVHLVGGSLVDQYVIERLLGTGGMGAVYGAQHERLGRRVAIKVISPSLSRDRHAIERFEQEAQALARLSHPNIVSVLSVGTLPGDERSYFVMEWLDGESLQTRLDRDHISLDDSTDIIDQIARGLEVAHAAGIVHRDLKPDNVWLQRVGTEPRPIVKLLDFGLAKLAEYRRSEETAVNVMFGTPQFMSPEQCRSARDVGPATDVYALGCIAYAMLCGRLPFDFDNAAELIVAHQTEVASRPSSIVGSIPPALDELVVRMLAKDPAQRPTLEEVRSSIASARARASIEALRPTVASVPSVPSVPPQRHASRRAFVALASLAVLGTIIAAVVTRDRASGRLATDGSSHTVQIDPNEPHPESRIAPATSPSSATPTSPTPTSPTPLSAGTIDPSIATNTTRAPGSAVITANAASKPDDKQPTNPRVEKALIKTLEKPGAETAIDKPVEKPKATTEVPAAAETAGTLSLDSAPPCNIYIDGKSLGLRTPQSAIKLPAGRHQIVLVNADFKITDAFSVEIKPGLIEKAFKHYKTDGAITINPFDKKKLSPPP